MAVTSANINQSMKTLFAHCPPGDLKPITIIGDHNKYRNGQLIRLMIEIYAHPKWFPDSIVIPINKLIKLQKQIDDKLATISDLEKIEKILTDSKKPVNLEKSIGIKKSDIVNSKKKLFDEVQNLSNILNNSATKELFAQIKKDYSAWFEERSKNLSVLEKWSGYYKTLENVNTYIEYLSKN